MQSQSNHRSEDEVDHRLQQRNDWRWQVRNAVTDIATVEKILGVKFKKAKRRQLEQTLENFPMRITPYYLSLVNSDDYEKDPIFLQSVPRIQELSVGKYQFFEINS